VPDIMDGVDPESKHAEPLMMAHMEIEQPDKREVCDDSAELLEVSAVKSGRSFLLRNQHKLAFGNQQCIGTTKFSLESVNNS
jgi:hypothetical protein